MARLANGLGPIDVDRAYRLYWWFSDFLDIGGSLARVGTKVVQGHSRTQSSSEVCWRWSRCGRRKPGACLHRTYGSHPSTWRWPQVTSAIEQAFGTRLVKQQLRWIRLRINSGESLQYKSGKIDFQSMWIDLKPMRIGLKQIWLKQFKFESIWFSTIWLVISLIFNWFDTYCMKNWQMKL